MKKIGIFYSKNTTRSKNAAQRIIELIGSKDCEAVNNEMIDGSNFSRFDNYILSLPTWWDGELPNYWDEFLPELEELDLNGKVFALFGHGDQKGYPENFADAIGIMAQRLKERGAQLIGDTSSEGYSFESSKALRADKRFIGLVLDDDNQANLTEQRITDWLKQILPQFNQ